MKLLIKTIIILILLNSIVSGCLPRVQTPENTPAISETNIIPTVKPSNTLISIETLQSTDTISPNSEPFQTATFTITPTPSETPTITPEPTKDSFSDAEILNVGYLVNNQLLVVLETKSEIGDEYYASIGIEEFQCEVLTDYPNRLYCNGKSAQIGQLVLFEIHSAKSEAIIFSIEISVPDFPTSTPKPPEDNKGGEDENPTDEPKPTNPPPNWTPES